MHGFYSVSVAIPKLILGNCKANGENIIDIANHAKNSNIVLFPELCITGYTMGDLFLNQTLYTNQLKTLQNILQATTKLDTIIVLGLAIFESNRLYNCAAVLQNGSILGVVPKIYLPNKKEFYEKRYFTSGKDSTIEKITIFKEEVPFGNDLIFHDTKELSFGVEICEDLWAITPPSNQLASNGATLILNLSASNELISKAQYRKNLIESQSARALCAYAYASSGIGESTGDTLFGGDGLIAENGTVLARSERFAQTSQLITAQVDLEKLSWLRVNKSTFCDAPQSKNRKIVCSNTPEIIEFTRHIPPHPFVPTAPIEQKQRCNEIVQILTHSLIARMQRAKITKAVIGLSGGLDSTLALLVVNKAFEVMNWDKKDIIAITMPSFGTTNRTKNNAHRLCQSLQIELKEIDITPIVKLEFKAIQQDENLHDVTFENVQARVRTTILMNTANKEGGLVVGTGDMSEIALGWNTYNGDHMSMYGLNSGIPKTLIRYIIEDFKDQNIASDILDDILDTPISPELIPSKNDTITQETEEIIGPYELHDFFLYHMLKYGATPHKILFLAKHAFRDHYDEATIKKWLKLFLTRFFTQQFKRNAMPDGPKVGTISLNPRADWRMPSDSDFQEWINSLNS